MASSLRRISLLVLCGFVLPGGAAEPVAGASARELDEVAVVGRKWRDLKRELIETEDRFYERFNLLNTREEFDIHCIRDKTTGTNVPQRLCRISFLQKAEAVEAREFTDGLTLGTAPVGVHTPLATLEPLWQQRREEYRRTARALLEKDPELMALATRLGRLREQYQTGK